jgi:single-stranded DNA-specific DHH superfamily exonuclease
VKALGKDMLTGDVIVALTEDEWRELSLFIVASELADTLGNYFSVIADDTNGTTTE